MCVRVREREKTLGLILCSIDAANAQLPMQLSGEKRQSNKAGANLYLCLSWHIPVCIIMCVCDIIYKCDPN